MSTQTVSTRAVIKRLDGKVAMITGGEQRIDRALLFAYPLKVPTSLSVTAATAAALRNLSVITKDGTGASDRPNALALQGDVSDTTQV